MKKNRFSPRMTGAHAPVQNSNRWPTATLLTLIVSLCTTHALGEDYYVVVGSFLNSDTAIEELSRRSDRSGNTLRIAITQMDNQTWHRLISGPFVNSATAQAEQDSWQQVGVRDAWITRLDIPDRRKKPLNIALNE